MGPRFRRVDRGQQFWLPPDVRDWLPAGHPALFVAELVEQLDLSAFVAGYRSTPSRGRPAYHPEVMVGIALYSAMTATMSSRRIERLLATDVGFRVVAANQRPDHNTICRFLVRHKQALEGLFAQIIGLAAEAGLVDPTLVALDGTKLPGDASAQRNVTLGELRGRFRHWAEKVEANDAVEDAAEAERGDGGGGPIAEMFEQHTMREWVRRRLDERSGDADDSRMNLTDPDSGLLKRSGGGWVQGYNAQAAAVSGGIVIAADFTASTADTEMLEPMTIGDVMVAATGQRAGVIVADAGYWNSDTIIEIDADEELPDVLVAPGQKLPDTAPAPLRGPDPSYDQEVTAYRQRLIDEHARRVAVVSAVINGALSLIEAGRQLGISDRRVAQLKDQWLAAGGDPDSVRPRRLPGEPRRPVVSSRAARCRHDVESRLARPAGRSLYRQIKAIIEPVFGDIKANRRVGRFLRRWIDNVKAEWHWILTGHNLTILHQRTTS